MLIQCDATALEWRCAAFLSKDRVAHNEIKHNIDQHTDNQRRFNLPSRLIAKTFVFRLIYGGSAFSYANDPNFMEVSRSEKWWQKVIDEFYHKYEDLHSWHIKLMQEAQLTGMVKLPTGRSFKYAPEIKNGNHVWPRTTILNYPVQGLGADVMAIARVSLYNRLKRLGIDSIKLVNTVHDSILVDAKKEDVDRIAKTMHSVFKDLPENFERLFATPFTVPMKCEVLAGENWKEMEEVVDK